MSESDKLFEELGYNKVKETEYWMESKNITIQELKAINEKIKELGWLEDNIENHVPYID